MAGRSPLKAKPLRSAGQALDERIQDIFSDRIAPYFFGAASFWILAAIEWLAWFQNAPRRPWLFTFFALLASLGFAAIFFRAKRTIARLKLGRDGEKAVAELLEGFRTDGARIFHDVPLERANIDHVVISGHGIVVVETKTLRKPGSNAKVSWDAEGLLIAGRKPDRDPLVQVAANMASLGRLLAESTGKKWPIRGAVVFPGWWVDPKPRSLKPDIWVLEPKALPTYLGNEPVRLEPSDVALAAFHLSRYIRVS